MVEQFAIVMLLPLTVRVHTGAGGGGGGGGAAVIGMIAPPNILPLIAAYTKHEPAPIGVRVPVGESVHTPAEVVLNVVRAVTSG